MFEAAGGRDVRLGGGVATVQQFLRAGLIDEMRLAFVPVLLGRGERLLDNLGDEPIGYECVDMVGSRSATHVRSVKKATRRRQTSTAALVRDLGCLRWSR